MKDHFPRDKWGWGIRVLMAAYHRGTPFHPSDLAPISVGLADAIQRLDLAGGLTRVPDGPCTWQYQITDAGRQWAREYEGEDWPLVPPPVLIEPLESYLPRPRYRPCAKRLEDAAPGGKFELTKLPGVKWEVIAVWQRSDASYQPVTFVEIYHPARGSRMIRAGDLEETLLTVPRPIRAGRIGQ